MAPNLLGDKFGVKMYLFRPVLTDPPLCSLKELQDGTYSIDDLADFHEALDLKQQLNKPPKK